MISARSGDRARHDARPNGPKAKDLSLRVLPTAILVLCLVIQIPSHAAPRGDRVDIVVLGDSYSSGNGAGAYYGPQGCYRSAAGWAEHYARALRSAGMDVALRNAACSGATTSDITREQTMDSRVYSLPMAGDRRGDETAARTTLNALGFCRPPASRREIRHLGDEPLRPRTDDLLLHLHSKAGPAARSRRIPHRRRPPDDRGQRR